MGSQFDADFVAVGFPLLQQVLGEDVVYVPFGGSAKKVTGIFTPEGGEPKVADDARIQFLRGSVQLSPLDAPSPDTRDRFELSGVVYSVKTFDRARQVTIFQVEAMRNDRLGGKDSHIQR